MVTTKYLNLIELFGGYAAVKTKGNSRLIFESVELYFSGEKFYLSLIVLNDCQRLVRIFFSSTWKILNVSF